MKFEVLIFSSSHCKTQCEDQDQDQDEDEDKDEEVVTHDKPIDQPHQKYQDKDEYEEVVTHEKPIDQPHFECIVRKYCLSRVFMVSTLKLSFQIELFKKI